MGSSPITVFLCGVCPCLLCVQVAGAIVMDLPGLLFFTTYTLLVLFWAEIYHQVRPPLQHPANEQRLQQSGRTGGAAWLPRAQRCLLVTVQSPLLKMRMFTSNSREQSFWQDSPPVVLHPDYFPATQSVSLLFVQARSLPTDSLRPAFLITNAAVYAVQVSYLGLHHRGTDQGHVIVIPKCWNMWTTLACMRCAAGSGGPSGGRKGDALSHPRRPGGKRAAGLLQVCKEQHAVTSGVLVVLLEGPSPLGRRVLTRCFPLWWRAVGDLGDHVPGAGPAPHHRHGGQALLCARVAGGRGRLPAVWGTVSATPRCLASWPSS